MSLRNGSLKLYTAAQSDSAAGFAIPNEPWMADAVCAQIGGDQLWFPEKGGSTRDAKKVCNGTETREPCPVRDQCLAHALKTGERFGIWGGYSERERRRLARGLPAKVPNVRDNGHGFNCRCFACKVAV